MKNMVQIQTQTNLKAQMLCQKLQMKVFILSRKQVIKKELFLEKI